MSIDSSVNVFFSPSTTQPGQWVWSFDPSAAPSLPYCETDYYIVRYYFHPSDNSWWYQAVSIALFTSRSVGYNDPPPRAILTQDSPMNKYAVEPVPGDGTVCIALFQFTNTEIALQIENHNNGSQNVRLGLEFTVTDGTQRQTSQDPQIKLPKQP